MAIFESLPLTQVGYRISGPRMSEDFRELDDFLADHFDAMFEEATSEGYKANDVLCRCIDYIMKQGGVLPDYLKNGDGDLEDRKNDISDRLRTIVIRALSAKAEHAIRSTFYVLAKRLPRPLNRPHEEVYDIAMKDHIINELATASTVLDLKPLTYYTKGILDNTLLKRISILTNNSKEDTWGNVKPLPNTQRSGELYLRVMDYLVGRKMPVQAPPASLRTPLAPLPPPVSSAPRTQASGSPPVVIYGQLPRPSTPPRPVKGGASAGFQAGRPTLVSAADANDKTSPDSKTTTHGVKTPSSSVSSATVAAISTDGPDVSGDQPRLVIATKEADAAIHPEDRSAFMYHATMVDLSAALNSGTQPSSLGAEALVVDSKMPQKGPTPPPPSVVITPPRSPRRPPEPHLKYVGGLPPTDPIDFGPRESLPTEPEAPFEESPLPRVYPGGPSPSPLQNGQGPLVAPPPQFEELTKITALRPKRGQKGALATWFGVAAVALAGLAATYGFIKSGPSDTGSNVSAANKNAKDLKNTASPGNGSPKAAPSTTPAAVAGTSTALPVAADARKASPIEPGRPIAVVRSSSNIAATFEMFVDGRLQNTMQVPNTPLNGIQASFVRAANKLAPRDQADTLINIKAVDEKLQRGAFAAYMQRFARVPEAEIQRITNTPSDPDHALLQSLKNPGMEKYGFGNDVRSWQSKIPVIENGKVVVKNYEDVYGDEMALFLKIEAKGKEFGWAANNNINTLKPENTTREIVLIKDTEIHPLIQEYINCFPEGTFQNPDGTKVQKTASYSPGAQDDSGLTPGTFVGAPPVKVKYAAREDGKSSKPAFRMPAPKQEPYAGNANNVKTAFLDKFRFQRTEKADRAATARKLEEVDAGFGEMLDEANAARAKSEDALVNDTMKEFRALAEARKARDAQTVAAVSSGKVTAAAFEKLGALMKNPGVLPGHEGLKALEQVPQSLKVRVPAPNQREVDKGLADDALADYRAQVAARKAAQLKNTPLTSVKVPTPAEARARVANEQLRGLRFS